MEDITDANSLSLDVEKCLQVCTVASESLEKKRRAEARSFASSLIDNLDANDAGEKSFEARRDEIEKAKLSLRLQQAQLSPDTRHQSEALAQKAKLCQRQEKTFRNAFRDTSLSMMRLAKKKEEIEKSLEREQERTGDLDKEEEKASAK